MISTISNISEKNFSLDDLISAHQTIDLKKIDAIEKEIDKNVTEWHQPYSDYATGGLNVAVLISPDGKSDNFSWDDCDTPTETGLLKSMPVLKELLYSFGLNIMASRLLKLDPGTFLHEHRDYVYLKEVERYRFHVPIKTNQKAHIITPGKKIHMAKGYLWRLDPKNTVHSACNFGTEPRIHLMMDCYSNDTLQTMLEAKELPEQYVGELPKANDKAIENWLREAEQLLVNNSLADAENSLLEKFCLYNLEEKTTYDLLDQFFENKEQLEERRKYWQNRESEVYIK